MYFKFPQQVRVFKSARSGAQAQRRQAMLGPGGNSSEVQRVGFSIDGKVSAFTGGTFTLTYGGQTTTALDWDALTTDVQSALEALSNIGTGNVAVSKARNSLSAQGWVLTFQGTLAGQNLSQVTITATGVQMSPTSTLTTFAKTDLDGGAATNEVQTVTLYSANGGNFTLTYIDQTTSPLAWNASATDVQTAMAALSNIGTGNVSVTGDAGGPWTLAFQGTLANTNLAALTGDITRLNTEAGLDGNGWAYDAALLGPEFDWYGATVTVDPGTATMVSANGQNIVVTGNGRFLTLLGTGVNGQQTDQAIQLLYDDGTQEVWTQSFSDWTTLAANLSQSFHPTTAYNTQAMAKINTTFAANGGFDQAGNAYDYNAVQQALAGSEIEWNLGSSNADNGWRAEGQSLELASYDPVTNPTYLYLLGASHNGFQKVNLVLHYSDGTQETWTQNIYDWNYQFVNQAGELINASFDHKVAYDGTSQPTLSGAVVNLFRCKYTLPGGKTLTSIELPNNPAVVLMGVTVTSVDSAYTTLGAVDQGTKIDPYGGLTHTGKSYDLASLKSVVANDSYWKHWSIPEGPNAVAGNGQLIPVSGTASGSSLHLLAACTGTCTNQNITLNFSDGTTKAWVQSFSSWQLSSSYAGERIVGTMTHYVSLDGTSQTQTTYVYDYSYALPANVRLTSIQLPNNYNSPLMILGMTIDGSSVLGSTAAAAGVIPVNAGEAVALTMDQRIKYDGTIDPTPVHLFGYIHPLPSDKQLVSMILPQNSNLIIAGMGTTDTIDFSQALNRLGKASQGTSIPAGGGLDQNGHAYDASQLGNSITSNGATFSLSTRTDLNAVASAGQLLSVPEGQYNYLNLLGTAVNGAQTQQAITLIYDDGTHEVWKQDFSDWTASQTVSGQSTVKTMSWRINSDGVREYGEVYLRSYRHQLPTGKQLVAVLLPENADLVFLSLAMS